MATAWHHFFFSLRFILIRFEHRKYLQIEFYRYVYSEKKNCLELICLQFGGLRFVDDVDTVNQRFVFNLHM